MGMTKIGTLRAALLFFLFLFLADTPICMVNSINTTDKAMSDSRTGLTIFDLLLATASVPTPILNGRVGLSFRTCKTKSATQPLKSFEDFKNGRGQHDTVWVWKTSIIFSNRFS
jgi:hypothetical protein